ncbi:hemerythrin domain-containing protein [uncultured Devosia sp.]|uniref:hemerythrin domain-containing protein n=1 Tax=uncultured Devosia sp. TaxID=211434 RepID=UPI002602A1F0|nr:hemerythrin domain-containing protein [uncultured Devosia sp.]
MPEDTSLDPLRRCYERVTAACDGLEQIADALPDRVPAGQCARAASEAIVALKRMHECELALLLPGLAASPLRDVQKIAADIEQAHKMDSEAVLEVQEVLLAFAAGRPILSADATGYLLRAFFEGLRRHIARQRDLIGLLADLPRSDRSLH